MTNHRSMHTIVPVTVQPRTMYDHMRDLYNTNGYWRSLTDRDGVIMLDVHAKDTLEGYKTFIKAIKAFQKGGFSLDGIQPNTANIMSGERDLHVRSRDPEKIANVLHRLHYSDNTIDQQLSVWFDDFGIATDWLLDGIPDWALPEADRRPIPERRIDVWKPKTV